MYQEEEETGEWLRSHGQHLFALGNPRGTEPNETEGDGVTKRCAAGARTGGAKGQAGEGLGPGHGDKV